MVIGVDLMRRYVVERKVKNFDNEQLQVCTVYPAAMNKKRVTAEQGRLSHRTSLLVFDRKTNKWRFEKL
jgi:hypothetical protein